MKSSRTRSLLLAAAMLALPAGISAQQLPSPTVDPQVQGWMSELQELHERLQSLQMRALQDSTLSAAQEALGTSIRTTMQQLDPGLEQGMARVKALETEFQAAQTAGDTVKQQQLGAEARQIQEQFITVQQMALKVPEIAAELVAFQGRLESKMVEIEPNAKELITRFREIEQQLASAAQRPSGDPKND